MFTIEYGKHCQRTSTLAMAHWVAHDICRLTGKQTTVFDRHGRRRMEFWRLGKRVLRII